MPTPQWESRFLWVVGVDPDGALVPGILPEDPANYWPRIWSIFEGGAHPELVQRTIDFNGVPLRDRQTLRIQSRRLCRYARRHMPFSATFFEHAALLGYMSDGPETVRAGCDTVARIGSLNQASCRTTSACGDVTGVCAHISSP
jgi:hypothetical protein